MRASGEVVLPEAVCIRVIKSGFFSTVLEYQALDDPPVRKRLFRHERLHITLTLKVVGQ